MSTSTVRFRAPERRKNKHTSRKLLDDSQIRDLRAYSTVRRAGVYSRLGTSETGLRPNQVEERWDRHGPNEVRHDKPAPALLQLLRMFRNPFVLILLGLLAVMAITDIVWADPADGPSYEGVITIGVMVTVSVALRFWQEYRSGRAAETLKSMVSTTATVTRTVGTSTVTTELPIDRIVPGDVVQLAAGDMIPADVRVVRAKDLQVDQSMLSGESAPAEKTATVREAQSDLDDRNILDVDNLAFLGTSVVSGSGTAVVVATGANTYFGAMTAGLATERPETGFDIGVRKVTFLLIRFMAILVPAIFVINGLTKDWGEAFLFGVVVAVGLTPEMLPLIVTANLAKGAVHMAKRKVIVKNLNAIQNFGAMDVLCTDKTGTLTEDRMALHAQLDVRGADDLSVLELAAVNSAFQTGLRNPLDTAILDALGDREAEVVADRSAVRDEMPFDFRRRRMSVVVGEQGVHDGTDLVVTKGAVDEVIGCCTEVLLEGRRTELDVGTVAGIERLVAAENGRGRRVLAVATRRFAASPGDVREYTVADESGMTLVGFLTFLAAPKESAAPAVAALQAGGPAVKVVTGDNELVAVTVSAQVGLATETVGSGTQLAGLDDAALDALVDATAVFARVDPLQKARIVESLQRRGHTVGFLGDGVNDAPALRAADVGISVDTAADIARESADIILLEKDLGVLEHGVVEGRRTFGNIMKYIKMTTSSQFGNVFSMLVASAVLPFLPMIAMVALIQNLIYDLSMLAIPWDRVDREFTEKPRTWETGSLRRFILFIGPISSIFDMTTFALMWFVFSANSPEHAALFQSGWFIESLISQTLIVHMIRTQRIPFVQSRASWPVLLTTGSACLFALVFPFTGLGQSFGLVPLPWTYFPWLIVTLVAYCAVTLWAKHLFIRRFGTWL